jgi:hypothetical protein
MTLSFTTPRRFIPTHHEASPRPSTFYRKDEDMTLHSSATALEQTPHVSDSLKRRAQSVINDKSIDPQWRAIIRYGYTGYKPREIWRATRQLAKALQSLKV